MSRRVLPAGLIVAVVVLFASLAAADPPAPVPKVDFKDIGTLNKYIDGSEAIPRSKEGDEFLDKIAKWYVWRVTESDATPVTRDKFIKELESQVVVKAIKGSKEFVNRFSPILAKRLKDLETLSFDRNQVGLLYGAQMLPIVARLKHDSLCDHILEILKNDARHPAIQMYAARALKEFFPVKHYEWDTFAPGEEPKRDRDVAKIELLAKRIEGKWPRDKMDEGAIHFIRREMIASLAEAQMPAVTAFKEVPKKKGFGAVEGTPVAALLHVLVDGALDPAPDLTERFHAVVGVCKLKCAAVPDYKPDAGVYLVGKFLLDLSDAYSKDPPPKKPAAMPWKIYAEQLKGLLQELENNTKGTTAHDKAKQISARAGPVLIRMVDYLAIADSAGALRDYVGSIRPKEDDVTLFKTVKGPTLKLAP